MILMDRVKVHQYAKYLAHSGPTVYLDSKMVAKTPTMFLLVKLYQ